MVKEMCMALETPKNVRVRFAPSPTGIMHLGNVRTALLNYLFAQKYNGTYILRIEDTDRERDADPGAKQILKHLAWLGIRHNEGPYFQSQRTQIYQEKLEMLRQKNCVYRCFCTQEELEKKRERQVALKKPPRYDRTCMQLSQEEIQRKLDAHTPFIWRFRLDHDENVRFNDLAHGALSFDLANFSDTPLTRQDGSVTFIFANAVDDMLMEISHVLRGDDHLTNTVTQIALYHALGYPIPIFWHLPILCNVDGKKLSKRDFGFSLNDLQDAGFLPQAIVNYLAIIGGSSTEEILPLSQLINTIHERPASTSHIKYDVEKLRWVNHRWVEKISSEELIDACKPWLMQAYDLSKIAPDILVALIELVRSDLVTLKDVIPATQFYFQRPTGVTLGANIAAITVPALNLIEQPTMFTEAIKKSAKQAKIPLSNVLPAIRNALTGSPTGPHVIGIIEVLGSQEARLRLAKAIG